MLIEEYLEGKYMKWISNAVKIHQDKNRLEIELTRRAEEAEAQARFAKSRETDDMLPGAAAVREKKVGEVKKFGLDDVIEEGDEDEDEQSSDEQSSDEEDDVFFSDEDHLEGSDSDEVDDFHVGEGENVIGEKDESSDEEEEVRRQEDVLDAFVHYTFHASMASSIVCDLQGIFDPVKNIFRLTDPAIHHAQKSKRCGRTDHGSKGIKGIQGIYQK